jgi:hypothetical protein
VQYQDGVAWLYGKVTDKQQMQTAIELTRQVEGVEHVICKMEIAPAESPATSLPAGNPRESEPSLLLAALDTPAEDQAQAPAHVAPAQVAPAQYAPAMTMPTRSTGRPTLGSPTRTAQQPNRQAMPMPMNQAQAAAVRQASYANSSGVQQAQCVPGCGPGGMGGDGMGGYGSVPGASGYVPGAVGGGVEYDNAQMPGYAWPSYAAYPNYAALTYPQQYSPTAWPYIGPFYPYPQVPLGWRKVTLEWDDGWWWLDFSHRKCH